jgi:hypothetical protein
MSTGPTFTSTTTADEVATAFSDEIQGKNGVFCVLSEQARTDFR